MEDAKLVDISGRKKENLKAKIDDLETKSKIKNIRDLAAAMTLSMVTSLELI